MRILFNRGPLTDPQLEFVSKLAEAKEMYAIDPGDDDERVFDMGFEAGYLAGIDRGIELEVEREQEEHNI